MCWPSCSSSFVWSSDGEGSGLRMGDINIPGAGAKKGAVGLSSGVDRQFSDVLQESIIVWSSTTLSMGGEKRNSPGEIKSLGEDTRGNESSELRTSTVLVGSSPGHSSPSMLQTVGGGLHWGIMSKLGFLD
jgi:hypothetical protein